MRSNAVDARIFAKEEVINMLVAEYDYDTDIAVQRAEERQIAFAEGIEKGIEQGLSMEYTKKPLKRQS